MKKIGEKHQVSPEIYGEVYKKLLPYLRKRIDLLYVSMQKYLDSVPETVAVLDKTAPVSVQSTGSHSSDPERYSGYTPKVPVS